MTLPKSRSLAILLLAGSRLFSQETPVAKSKVTGLFWKATSGDKTAWVLGSVHLGSKEMYPLPAAIEDAFSRASTVLVEVDINKVDPKVTNQFVLSKGIYQGDDGLSKHVSQETLDALHAFCEQYNMQAGALERLRPWLVSITVTLLPLQKMGMTTALGIDKYFLDKAKDSKKVESIESAEWQFDLLSSIPENLQEKYLSNAVKQAARLNETAKEMQDTWIEGSAEKLDAILARSSREPAELQRKLREDRNPRMADALEACVKRDESCFLIVGAAHTVGKDSVVSLLEKKGFKLQQVR